LPIVKSLGRRNIGTTLMVQKGLVPQMFSRWHSESVYCPSSLDDSEGFLKNLLRLVKTGKYFTIFPIGDNSLMIISKHREQLALYLKLALPSHESVIKALDKFQTLAAAEKLGIPIPKTFLPKNIVELREVSIKIQYPAVIKPRSFFRGQNGKTNFSRPCYVNSASELISTYSKVEKDFPSSLIQEFVPGQNISVALLFDHCEPMAACAIGVKRTKPVTGGDSVLRESIPLDPMLLRYATTLLRSLKWHGVAEVEFKVDSRDRTPKLMEINARFWGSMNVAIDSGVDFPYLLYLLAKGEQIRPVFNYRIGVKFRWLNGDVQNLQSTLKGEPKLVTMKPSNKLKAVLRFLKFYEKNIHYDGFSWFDPLPFFLDEALFLYETAKSII
jgi:predicted ATP-grasp superfamily ATP-dependent carboligase